MSIIGSSHTTLRTQGDHPALTQLSFKRACAQLSQEGQAEGQEEAASVGPGTQLPWSGQGQSHLTRWGALTWTAMCLPTVILLPDQTRP